MTVDVGAIATVGCYGSWVDATVAAPADAVAGIILGRQSSGVTKSDGAVVGVVVSVDLLGV